MNYLWYGGRFWPGWKSFVQPAETGALNFAKSALGYFGFITTTAAVNTATFPPIAMFLENANVENFTKGLGFREFVLSVPRKILQSRFGPNSIEAMIAYTIMKISENEIASSHFAFFAGKGMYREPLKELLEKDSSSFDFMEFSLNSLGSCASALCNDHSFEKEDFKLLAIDMLTGKVTPDELQKIATHIVELEKNKEDRFAIRTAMIWTATFEHALRLKELKKENFEGGLEVLESFFEYQIENINNGTYDK